MRGQNRQNRSITRLATAVMLTSLGAVAVPLSAQANHAARSSQKPAAAVAKVRFIQHGLGVRAPRAPLHRGRVNQKLFNAYFLRTKQAEKASVKFGDGTVMHINSRTDLVLKSAHLTQIQQGEIDEVVQPGTVHRVQAATAIAGAIGTEFDVKEIKASHDQKKPKGKKAKKRKITKGKTIITVVEGALVVDTPQGRVTVKTNQQTTIIPGEAPQPPISVDARKSIAWTKPIPPVTGRKENIALDSNGGHIIAASSQLSGVGDAGRVNDGRLDTGWETAQGRAKGEWVKLGFSKDATYDVAGVVIDPSATGNIPAGDAVKDFEILSSTTNSADGSFAVAYRGTTEQGVGLQRFLFSKPVPAKYLEMLILSTQGGTARPLARLHASDGSATVAELEAISSAKTIVPPAPTPTPTSAASPTPTLTPTSQASPTATFTPVPSPTPVRAGFKFAFSFTTKLKEPGNAGEPLDDDDKTLTILFTGHVCGSDPYAQPFTVEEQYTLIDPSDNIFGPPGKDSFTVSFKPGQSTAATGDTSQIGTETLGLVEGPSPTVQFQVHFDPTVGEGQLDYTVSAPIQEDTSCPKP